MAIEKTSENIRKAVDEYLLYDDSDYFGGASQYLCDVLALIPNGGQICGEFIRPDVLGWSLFETSHSDGVDLSDDEYHRRQEIRFTLAEIIACHFESIGD